MVITSQHKLWKHVLPRQTEFAWLPPDFADACCHTALQADPTRKYGIVGDFLDAPNWKANITLEQMYLIGDIRSAHELEVFINMPIERLRVGCGLQCAVAVLGLPILQKRLYGESYIPCGDTLAALVLALIEGSYEFAAERGIGSR